jgi:O-antigen/teichoic acid export membrane protein
MARLRTNLLANFAGAGWSTAVQIACVPILIKLLGIEAYGLIGFFVTLQVTLQVLDLGVSATVSRELARYSTLPDKTNEVRDFLRTLEVAYWAVGLVISLAVILLAPVIAVHWLNASTLSVSVVQHSIEIMGLIIALQWPIRFYQGGLMGLQRLVPLNFIRIVTSTLNTGGALLVLWLVSASVQTFFLWQLMGSLAHVILIATVLWRSLPAVQRRPRFDMGLVRGILPFAKGMSGIVVLGTILAQMDKIVLSKFLSLTEFGYYTAAAMVAGGLQLFITPIYSAVFPRLSALVMNDDIEAIRRLYHTATQLMAVCVLPTAIVLAIWAPQFITLWTGNPEIAAQVAPLAVLLLLGTAMNGLMHLPLALQLAYGWTRLNLNLSIYGVLVFAPLFVWAGMRYGAVGGAATWALLNFCYLVLGLSLMHRRLLRGDLRRWIVRDVGYPLFAILVIVAIAHQGVDGDETGIIAALQLGCVGLAAVAIAGLAAPEIRAAVLAGRIRSRLLFDV